MPATMFRKLLFFLITVALLALCACGGSKTQVCTGDCCNPTIACPAVQFLYANGLNGQIAAYLVEPGGALGTPTFTPGSALSLGMVALNNSFLYTSSLAVTLKASSITAWKITPVSGALTTVSGSPFTAGIFNAAGLAADPLLNVIYVADAGQIDAFKADANGALTPVAGSPFASGSNLFLAVDPMNRFLFASADDPPGSVFAFTIDPGSGALTPVPGSPFATSPILTGNTMPAQIVVDASGNFVFVALSTSNEVAAFAITPSSGALTPVPGSPFAAGNAPFSIATSNFQAGNFVYVSNRQDGTISGYSITSGSGVLVPLAGSPFAIPATALAIHSLSNVLYASTTAGIRAFTIDPQTGALTEIAGSPFAGSGASGLAFAP